ncbi:MAG: acyl carrier protein [Candidatus Thiodiazotropha sp. (ex Epidulcina cf. delphinae)]|nr:acyl carrier protein [Candidatus Thiodiazotropha sp. (ex Epidulcina cf. delphinae)]
MKGSLDTAFKLELKQMIVEECRLDDISAEEMLDDEYLVGLEARFGLDSIDMLQVIAIIKNRYGVRIRNDAESREILATINALADHLQPE